MFLFKKKYLFYLGLTKSEFMMLGILIITVPLLIYVIGALSVAKKDITHPDDFFVAFKKVGKTAFSTSSIAYAFQVSTIYPFLLWGASNFFFVPAVNSISWGLGILLFYLCYDKYKRFIGQELTLHGFLGEQYGQKVRVIASYLTIIAFLGFAISETYFGSKVLLAVVSDKISFYFIISIALLFVYGYISYGGQVSSIRTDQLQLIISYIGVFGLILYLIYVLISRHVAIPNTLSWSLVILFLYIIAVGYFRRFKFINFNEEDTKINRYINISLNLLVVIILGLVAVVSFIAFTTCNTLPSAGSSFFNIDGFGIPGLLSLIILPLSFQFVDLSNWQRLLSVKSNGEKDDSGLEKNIKGGLLVYAVESPFTWVIFIFFGLLSITALPNFKFNDLLIDIPNSLIHSQDSFQNILGYLFIISVIAIMLSTVDSFIMGMIFTYVYDSNPQTRKLLDAKDSVVIKNRFPSIIKSGRLFGLAAVLCGIVLFIVFDKKVSNGGEMFINLLLAFYSAQLAFLPLVFGILFLKNHPSTIWAILSMTTGALAGIGVGIYAVIFNPEWAWYPILICFILSSLIYLLGYVVKKKK